MAPEETTTETTQTPAETPVVENGGETEVDPFENATKGIKDRLTRLTRQIEKNQIEPLKQQIAELEAVLDKHGIEREGVVQESTPAEAPEQGKEKQAGGEVVDMVGYYRTKAAFDAGLPQEALPFLTATTEAELKTQAEMLKALPWNSRRRVMSPIRPDAGGETAPRIYKRSDLRNGKFYLDNKDEIHKAMAEGRFDYTS